MKLGLFLPAVLFVLPTLCAPTQAAAEHHESAASRAFELPTAAGEGEGKEVVVLMDEDDLKMATVALRGGTALPAHSTPVPATVQVLEGEGVIHVAGEAVAVSRGTIVWLAAGAEHDVVPAAGSDMLLLVHYLRSAAVDEKPPLAQHDH